MAKKQTPPPDWDDEREPLSKPEPKKLKLSGNMVTIPLVREVPQEEDNPGPLGMMQEQFSSVLQKPALKVGVPPTGYFNLKVGDHKVILVDKVGTDWTDVMVWDRELKCSLHVQRKNLTPKEDADAAIEFLSVLK